MTLTPRESDVYRLLLTGKSTVEIASELGITLGTLKQHSHWIYRRFNVTGRVQLIANDRDIENFAKASFVRESKTAARP